MANLIIASNGQQYDLDNLLPNEKRVLQTLGHLPKDVDSTTPSEDVEQSLIVQEVVPENPTNDAIDDDEPKRKRK